MCSVVVLCITFWVERLVVVGVEILVGKIIVIALIAVRQRLVLGDESIEAEVGSHNVFSCEAATAICLCIPAAELVTCSYLF